MCPEYGVTYLSGRTSITYRRRLVARGACGSHMPRSGSVLSSSRCSSAVETTAANTETETSALSEFEKPKTYGGVERVRRDGAALDVSDIVGLLERAPSSRLWVVGLGEPSCASTAGKGFGY
jgi:hypothetical protein